ncbi:MAG: SDR family NAD(P)-dependent oxidoreductase [Bacteroidales bacterium]|nr:SDR family NAD(P)-dependent oxidoreductase [Bacteroidales bacterium]
MGKFKVDRKNFRKYRSFALVTGAASGMGRLYAQKLAALGYNLVIVDINAEKLDAVGEEVCAQVASYTDFRAFSKDRFRLRKIVQNLAMTDAARNIAAQTEDLEVEVLVNNAGIMYAQKICDTTRKTLSTIMLLHNYTPLMMCREFVPAMQKRHRGYVLNVSSLGAWMNWPAIGMYGATKRFIKDFSRELRIECRGTGVSVTNAYFGAVNTSLIPLPPNLRKLACNLHVMISAEKATDKALKATFKRRKGTMPGFLNKIFKPICAILPDCVPAWIVKKLGKYILMDV